MSDLIRKSDVLDLLYRIFDKYKMSTDKNTSIGKSFGTDVFEEMRNLPTAYDIGKVVEELGKLQTYNMSLATLMSDLQRNGVCRHYICLEDAIEIVKQGSVSDCISELENLKARR